MRLSFKPVPGHALRFFLAIVAVSVVSIPAWGQGETTSAILGQVTDSSNAAIPRHGDCHQPRHGIEANCADGRCGTLQLPAAEAGHVCCQSGSAGFEPRQADNIVSGLGQKQTVNLTLRVAQSKEIVEVGAEAPIINPTTPTHRPL